MHEKKSIIVLLPFLVKGALALIVLRAMRDRGFDVTIGYYMPRAEGYSPDDCADFAKDDRLLNLCDLTPSHAVDLIVETCRKREAHLLLQIGAPQAYRQIPYIRERLPSLRVYDMLYNPIGHTVNHFLYESAFDLALVESHAMNAFIHSNTMMEKKETCVVESGIDLADFFQSEQRLDNFDEFNVGYVGRMSPEKNPVGFIELAENLAVRDSRLRFRLFGEGPQLKEVENRIAASPAADVIKLDGYVAHVRDAMHKIDCLVVPSKLDGRPNIIMEANACGVPVIGAPVGGIPELIVEGVNGYMRSPLDTDGIASVLSMLIDDASLRSSLREMSRMAAIDRFDRDRMLDEYARVLAPIAVV